MKWRSGRATRYGVQLPFIAVTGWGQESDKRMVHAAGFDHHLTKPVEPESLAELFEVGGVELSVRLLEMFALSRTGSFTEPRGYYGEGIILQAP